MLGRALTRRGRFVIVGSEADGRWLGGFDRSIRATLMSPFVRQRLAALTASENADDLAALAELVGSGKVVPLIHRTNPLDQTVAAICRLLDRHTRGKVVVALVPGREVR